MGQRESGGEASDDFSWGEEAGGLAGLVLAGCHLLQPGTTSHSHSNAICVHKELFTLHDHVLEHPLHQRPHIRRPLSAIAIGLRRRSC